MPDGRPLRIGLVAPRDPANPNKNSGMPFAARQQFRRLGAEVVDLWPSRRSRLLMKATRCLPHVVREIVRGSPIRLASLCNVNPVFSGRASQDEILSFYRDLTAHVALQISRHELDVLFGALSSTVMYELRTEIPIVYFSDFTARLMVDTYEDASRLPAPHRAALDTLERFLLRRADAVVMTSECTRRSAIEDYGVSPERVQTVYMGPNVVPEGVSLAESSSPTRDDLSLLVVAAEPVRKRVDLCIEVTERLRERGWNARLTLIGPATERARSSPHVRCLGRLRLGNRRHQDLHEEALRDAHVLLLPSLAEAAGLAPIEAAHAGRPSVVSDAGGLPEMVEDGRTGRVVPVGAGVDEYASAVEDLVADRGRYLEICRDALSRARELFTWDRWGEKTMEIVERAVRDPSPTGAMS